MEDVVHNRTSSSDSAYAFSQLQRWRVVITEELSLVVGLFWRAGGLVIGAIGCTGGTGCVGCTGGTGSAEGSAFVKIFSIRE